MALPTETLSWAIPKSTKDISGLTKKVLPLPAIGHNQALVRITAASLNYRDLLVATHSPSYPGDHKDSLILASDSAGVIHHAPSSSKWAGKEGINVLLHPNTWLSGDVRNLRLDQVYGAAQSDGVLTEWKVVDDERLIEVVGDHLSAGEIASLATAGATAWSAIREALDARLDGTIGEWKGSWRNRRLAGNIVLTQGTGGVSCFGIQIASALGATVIATSSSDEKLELAKSIGASHTINYKKIPDWDQEVLRLTEGRGVDIVLDVGGHETILRSIASTRPGGLICVLGILTAAEQLSASLVPAILFGGKILKGSVAFSRDSNSEFAQFIVANGIKPVIAKEFAFDDVVAAMSSLGKAAGKIIVKVGESN